MYYVVQENVFREENYNNLIIALERFGLPYEVVHLEKGCEDFEFETKEKNVFPFGAVKMARLSNKYGWYPGSQMCSNHDYEVYSKYYKENLLNYDSEIVKFGDNFVRDGSFFARPTEDTKVFTGRVFTMQEWKDFVKESYENPRSNILTKDTPIQISTVKNIQKEIRFWIVKGKIVTASQYVLGNTFFADNIIDDDAFDFVNEMIKIFEINDTFTMDICLTNGEYKIVECGCISSAGFYRADMQKLIMALEDAFNDPNIENIIYFTKLNDSIGEKISEIMCKLKDLKIEPPTTTQQVVDFLGNSEPPKPISQEIIDSINDGSFFKIGYWD